MKWRRLRRAFAIATFAAPFILVATSVAPFAAAADMAPKFGFTALHVADLERSVAFYSQILGMRQAFRMSNGTSADVALGFPNSAEPPHLLLIADSTRTGPYSMGDAFVRISFFVPDAAALCEKVRASGGIVIHPPTAEEKTHMTVGVVKDPDGYLIELIQLPPHAGPSPN